ncbi:alpha/beta hydrolase [Alkalimarinus alittae]|uniref:Lysophospholipase n=1 Tax=Alkalimarinus alittae TaxID=2961619 RepID=A0ABY6N533_9ALTE|nr:lysophospholipase [Alkalimarinus alittae]UZE97150.1 lysophospholipase [Alkalimarinus alittae]
MRKETLQFNSLGDSLTGMLFIPENKQSANAALLPAVIICHGAVDYKEHFFGFAMFLAENGYATLALDMHGHGESEGGRYHVKMAEWVPDVNAAIDVLAAHPEIDASRIGALGFSSGGTAVLEAAAQQSRLNALVTLDATVRNVINPLEVAFFKSVSKVGALKQKISGEDIKLSLYEMAIRVPVSCNPDVSQTFFDDPYFKAGYSAYPLPGAIESVVIDTLDRVDKITIPVCVIHGEDDQVDPPKSARLLYKKLRAQKQLNIIPRSGHVGHLDYQKDKIHDLAKQWFDIHL